MNTFILIANWKASMTLTQSTQWLRSFVEKKPHKQSSFHLDISIAPPFPLITPLSNQINENTVPFSLCAQDISAFPPGAYTGEVSAQLLASLNVKYALVGHSERRKNLGENNQLIEHKINLALQAGIIPIVCAQNLEEIPENVRNHDYNKFLIMYEPFSAISTNGMYHPESPDTIFQTLTDWSTRFPKTKLLYGGSINSANVLPIVTRLYSHIPNFSGLVVGHASLDITSFFEIIRSLYENTANPAPFVSSAAKN